MNMRTCSYNATADIREAHFKAARPFGTGSLEADCMTAFRTLQKMIYNGDLFKKDETDFLLSLKIVFDTEIRYLKTAYVANAAPPRLGQPPAPSEILLGERSMEVDRTFTGMLALYWIYHRDYAGFTRNQSKSSKLTESSFEQLCAFFHRQLDNFNDSRKVMLLITLQVTNDLGKSDELKQLFIESGARDGNINHDMLLYQVLEYHSELIPSINCLEQKDLLRELIRLGSEYNPGQLVQGESMPALLEVLHEVDLKVEDLCLKFMENFLDISGALGHIDHDGSSIMTDPVFKAYNHARQISEDVLLGGSTDKAWKDVLNMRLRILQDVLWKGADSWSVYTNSEHRTKARLLCMGRAAKADVANLIVQAFDHYLDEDTQNLLIIGLNEHGTVKDPAVLPTYMPEMFSLVFKAVAKSDRETKLEALAAIMRYLARVLRLSEEDRQHIRSGVIVVERDVKQILKPIIESEEFVVSPWLVLNEGTELPGMQVAREVRF
ncbi:hypothetical protein H2198_003888 [Neophaeococcomyces mojaviensis]|uniref:Uncharacterized protein n=1 Tax=Neophaeococcomyces mojaviensis TaxID=3383035 RepID=A0ACC3AAA7_9EURO|nr:hypothetical protein H2198_003888 [Knufia sp. JES_112]